MDNILIFLLRNVCFMQSYHHIMLSLMLKVMNKLNIINIVILLLLHSLMNFYLSKIKVFIDQEF